MTVVRNRYEVWATSDGFKIMDLALGGFCSLGGMPLRWQSRREARVWLLRCYRIWGIDPTIDDEIPAEDEWPDTPGPEPERGHLWSRWTTPVDPWEMPKR